MSAVVTINVSQRNAPLLSLRKTIASLARNRGRWEQLMRGARHARQPASDDVASRLDEVHGFGSNPGSLRMFRYLPSRLAANPALVVVLHGCTQTAAGYDLGAGWSTLADRYGFALLLPEQQSSNNPKACFNWFQSDDITRDRGEALSIRQMVEQMARDHGIDRSRVFITGLSAGGAMTSVMLACYPEVFAAGAIIAGLPYGAATNVQQAFESMFQSPARSASEWGDLVRRAAPHNGPWPRISVWHGGADKTVIPTNAREIVKQWTDVHGLPTTPSREAMVDGYPRQAWLNQAGDEVIESYTITHMAHGTPISTGAADDACGAAGPFLLEVGISSSYHIAKFFHLTAADRRPFESMIGETAPRAPDRPRISAPAAPPAQPEVLEGEVLEGEVLDRHANGKPEDAPPPHRIDIGAVIAKALTAAGLMKGPGGS
jgi:poly(hydroxyalkanoate) depolymerase family esterase